MPTYIGTTRGDVMKICMTNQAKETVQILLVVATALLVITTISAYVGNTPDLYWIKDIGHLLLNIVLFGAGVLIYYWVKNSFYIKDCT